ncbi:MAG: zinc metalloprotease [Actinomycetota bacterium]
MRSRARVLLAVIALAAVALPASAGASSTTAFDKALAAIDAACDVHLDGVADGASDLRVKQGGNAAKDPNTVSAKEVAAVRPPPGGGTTVHGGNIPVYFHIVTSTSNEGAISDSVVAAQIAVMNDAFDFSALGANESWTFTLAGTTRTANNSWFTATPGSSQETQMKAALHQGSMDDLNVYTGKNDGSLLGWATFPTKSGGRGGVNTKDGVVIAYDSVPGGSFPYDEGDTLVHEAGHWMGLYHTFQGGCSGSGDQVADTPAEATPNLNACNENRDTCVLQAGKDPIHNFMDYSPDACMFEFTPGQDERMDAQYSAFRNGK